MIQSIQVCHNIHCIQIYVIWYIMNKFFVTIKKWMGRKECTGRNFSWSRNKWRGIIGFSATCYTEGITFFKGVLQISKVWQFSAVLHSHSQMSKMTLKASLQFGKYYMKFAQTVIFPRPWNRELVNSVICCVTKNADQQMKNVVWLNLEITLNQTNHCYQKNLSSPEMHRNTTKCHRSRAFTAWGLFLHFFSLFFLGINFVTFSVKTWYFLMNTADV